MCLFTTILGRWHKAKPKTSSIENLRRGRSQSSSHSRVGKIRTFLNFSCSLHFLDGRLGSERARKGPGYSTCPERPRLIHWFAIYTLHDYTASCQKWGSIHDRAISNGFNVVVAYNRNCKLLMVEGEPSLKIKDVTINCEISVSLQINVLWFLSIITRGLMMCVQNVFVITEFYTYFCIWFPSVRW